jgi:hypothetical protein
VGVMLAYQIRAGTSTIVEEKLLSAYVEQELWAPCVEQGVDWASSRPSPEQEPPKSLLLVIGVMT